MKQHWDASDLEAKYDLRGRRQLGKQKHPLGLAASLRPGLAYRGGPPHSLLAHPPLPHSVEHTSTSFASRGGHHARMLDR